MKKLLLGVCVVSLFAVGSVQALEVKKPAINSIKTPIKQKSVQKTTTNNKINPSGTIGQINTQLYSIDTNVQTAYNSLFSALLSKEDYNKFNTELQSIKTNKNLSETEKSAKIAQIATDTSAILANKEKQDEISENLKTLSATKKTEYTNALINLTSAGFQYANLALECKNIGMSLASNPAKAVSMAFEIGQLKDTGKLLKSNVKSLKDVTAQVIAINKANGIVVNLPENKSSGVKKVNFSQLSK